MTKEQRKEIALKTNNRCGYCGTPLQKGYHLDHIKPIIRGYMGVEKPENDTIDNMMASCPSCNILKTSGSVEQLRASVLDRTKQLSRQASYRTALRYGLLKECPKEVVFYFEEIGVLSV